MDYDIRYVTSADGTIIAVLTRGSGPVLLSVPGIANLDSAMAEYLTPDKRLLYDGLSRDHTLVTYDARGIGLSQREVEDVSLEAHVADLVAVIDSVGRVPVAFRGRGSSCPIVVNYLAAHPDRASRLILVGPTMKGSDRAGGAARRVIAPIMEYDFDLWVRVLLLMELGWKDGAVVYDAIGSNGIAKEMLQRQFREMRRWDMSADLPRLTCPTLVMYIPTPDVVGTGLASAQQVAAMIPDARFQPIEWDLQTSPGAQLALTRAFLGTVEAPNITTAPRAATDAATAVILFTDIVDSTSLTERLGDTRFREASRSLDTGLRNAIRDAGGAAIDAKTLGDGVLATFPSAAQAIDAAQRCLALTTSSNIQSPTSNIQIRVGLHAGDVIREDNNVFGGAVNIAARICALSAPGEILVSDVVRGMARSSANVNFDDRGEQEMKGVGDPIRIYAVHAPV